MDWVRSLRALRLATISVRIASTAPSRPFGTPAARPDCAARAALTASSGSDSPLPVPVLPVLPVRAVYLHDPHARRGQVPGQARAVAAGALNTDHGEVPEPGQPLQQAAVTRRRSRELPDAQQLADGIERGGDMHIASRDELETQRMSAM